MTVKILPQQKYINKREIKMYREIHVSKRGNDSYPGTLDKPYLTISRAAAEARPGDTVTVHEGVYRESVNPINGGRSESERIVYRAAENEKVIIKGSEQISEWQNEGGMLWHAELPDSFFGAWNPYKEIIDGDWLMSPVDRPLHTGQVYLNGTALTEAGSIEQVMNGKMKWFCCAEGGYTHIYANFGDADPNKETAEINTRKTCFYPEKTGIDYITVRGLEMSHAACPWAPPTADQPGMIGPHWSKGWIIEDNIFHDARCSAVSLGKEITTGDNRYTHDHFKPGYQYQLETVFKALHIGWSRERIGSHIVRNNVIYDCGQNAIVGHMGGAFSRIYGNHIYNIGNKHEFFGYEIAGIKLHAAIDTVIENNNIHDCWLGTWLDWQAQGVRVSRNLYHHNERDIWIEVTHGPHIVDNNIFGSGHNFSNAAQGGAYIHNLFCGSMHRYDVRDRSTPYHIPHSTDVAGTAVVYGGDDRFYQNIFAGSAEDEDDHWKTGTSIYNGYPDSMEKYIELVMENGRGDIENYIDVKQPVYIGSNCYLNGAEPYDGERCAVVSSENSEIMIFEENGDMYMEINIPSDISEPETNIIDTYQLGVPRISEARFEAADGSDISFDTDFFGNLRSEAPTVGPFENLKRGSQKIRLMKIK